MVESYRNVVIGSGEGGKYLAWHLASRGEKTVVVERRYVGGGCPNTNCLPSKNEIWSAHLAHVRGGPADMPAVLRRKREMVDALIAMHHEKFAKSGAELLMGEARLEGPGRVAVGDRVLEAERIFLNVGTRASVPSTPGLAESGPLTHVELLELDRLPEHLIVIGGGYIGLEFAQAYRRFGSRVTVLQHNRQLIPKSDEDVAAEVQRFLEAEGVEVVTSARIASVAREGAVVRVSLGDREIVGTDILVATGRTPNTEGLGPVQLDKRGYIVVNDRLETSVPGVWALGECAGSPQFTHASFDDFRVVRENLAGRARSTAGRLMPSVLFTAPEVAQVGLTEAEAKAQGVAYRLARIPVAAVLRTRTSGETDGFLKALVGEDLRILGFAMVGPQAGEVLAVVQMAMLTGQPCTFLADAILSHPTMAEGLNALFAPFLPG